MGQPIKIYVGNIPQSARSSELKELFEKFGKVVECDILKEFAFVHMEDTNDAKAAIAGLNDSLWKGSRIRVELSTTKTSKGEPSMRHRNYDGDVRGGGPPARRRSSRERDYRGRSPPYVGRDSGRDYNPRFGGAPSPYRSSDIRGAPMRDSRYAGGPPPPRSRPYPEAYDRRGYPIEPNGRGPMGPRGAGYIPEYPFHPASYREPMRDHRGGPYSDPYGRGPPMGYGAPMPPYYRGPPMPGPGRGYDYPPQGYPSSRPSRYSPPPSHYRGLSPRGGLSRDDGPTFNGHHIGTKSSSKRHHSNDSHSPSPARRNGHGSHKIRATQYYSRSPSPTYRNGNGNSFNNSKSRDTRSRSHSPRPNGSTSRSPSPANIKQRRHKSKDSKAKHASDGSSSNNSSLNEAVQQPRRKVTRHSKKSSMSPVTKKKYRSKRATTASSPSRSRSKSSNRSNLKA